MKPYYVNKSQGIVAITGAALFIAGLIMLLLKEFSKGIFLLTYGIMAMAFAFLDIVKQDKQI